MKTKFVTSLLLLTQLNSAYAQSAEPAPTRGASGYPYLAESNCTKNVVLPKNSGGILFNKDCSVGFVYPQRKGTASLLARPSMALTLCENLSQMKAEIDNYQTLKEQQQKKLMTASDEDAQKIYKIIGQINDLQSAAQQRLDSIEAMRVNVTFENSIDEAVAEAQEKNPGKTIFQAAPLSAGVLHYIVEDPQDHKSPYRAVLSTRIPGNNRTINGDQGEVDFNGALQGELALTLNGACPFIQSVQKGAKKYLTIDEKKLNHTITANYTYAVPTQSALSYTATLDARTALGTLKTLTNDRSGFFKNDIVDSFLNNGISNIIKIEYNKAEIDASDEDIAQFKEFMNGDIADRLTKRFLEVLEKNKLVLAGAPAFKDESLETIHGIRRECKKQSFLGIVINSYCYDVPYTYTVRGPSIAAMIDSITKSWNITITEAQDINQIVYRRGTSTFELKQTEPVLIEVK